MTRHDRVDATALTLLGVVLLVGGGYGAARGFGALGADAAGDPVLSGSVRSFVDRHEARLWPAAAALALIIAYLAWRWLRRQLVGFRVSRLDLSERADGEPTFVQAVPAAAALSRDVEAYRGVRKASARFLADGSQPEMAVTVDVDDDAEVVDLNRRIEEHAFVRFRQALELEDLGARIRYRFSGPPPGR